MISTTHLSGFSTRILRCLTPMFNSMGFSTAHLNASANVTLIPGLCEAA